MSVKVIYESDDFIVVDKPYDMYINSNDENEKNTVAAKLGNSDSHLATSATPLRFVHRLDYATSGVLCIAKNKQAAAKAGKLFQKRAVRKYYLAVIRGHVAFDTSLIQYDIGEDTRTDTTNHRMLSITTADDTRVGRYIRNADTKLLVLEKGYYEDAPATIVLLKPNTGRRHQLRVHCASIGHPILGDFTYTDGGDSQQHRMYLHATRLVLPMEGELLDLQTEDTILTDEIFKSKWKSDIIFHNIANYENFITICDYIDELDNTNVIKYIDK